MGSPKLWIGMGLALGVVVAVALGHRATDRLRADAACAACHSDLPGLQGATVESHPAVTCQTCHVTDLPTAWRLSRARAIPAEAQVLGENVPAHGRPVDPSCGGCHTGGAAPQQVAHTAGHQAHLGGALGCADCHKASVHDGRPAADGCTASGCHDTQRLARSPMAEQHCLTCHQFLAPATGGDPGRFVQCAECHGPDSARALPVGLHAQVPCEACHRPHQEPFTRTRACNDCHAEVAHAHPQMRGVDYCTACHGPHDEWARAVERCGDCHEDQILEGVPEAIAPMVAIDDTLRLIAQAEQAAHATCEACHASHDATGVMGSKHCDDCHDFMPQPPQHHQASCDDCHAPHRPQSPGCATCHGADVRVSHGRTACEDCHSVHADPVVQTDCRACHADVPRGGHPKSQCQDCHDPHRPQAIGCDGCHQDQVRAVRGLPAPEHTDCSGCHPAHTWTAAAGACQSCHVDQAKATTGLKDHQDCASCHASHSQRTDAPAQCVDCHRPSLARTVKDHQDCAACHDVHSGSRAGKQDCKDCHAERFQPPARGVPRHDDCAACHAVHPDATWRAPTCQACHNGTRATRPVALHTAEGHQNCGDCHTAHAPVDARRAACLTCHEEQRDHEPKAPLCNGCHLFKAP